MSDALLFLHNRGLHYHGFPDKIYRDAGLNFEWMAVAVGNYSVA